jgi:DNA polymerase I-like protein with 3'-5' exonuclease and polymerase domains
MAQLHDNGGDWRDLVFNNDVLDPEASPDLGCSLEAAASRVLGKDLHNHKAERDAFLKEHHGIRSKQGSFIHLLPSHILKSYNIADTVVTLELFEHLDLLLRGIWEKDWDLYYNRTDLMNKAYRKGININLPALYTVITKLEAEIALIEANYLEFMHLHIIKWAELYKTCAEEFNIGSNKQLKELYVGVLGMKAGHLTEKGQKAVKDKELTLDEALNEYPSFQSKHLGDWGESGKLLIQRRKRLLVLSQAISTFTMASMGNGRIHPEVRVAGTRTNRVSGGRDE